MVQNKNNFMRISLVSSIQESLDVLDNGLASFLQLWKVVVAGLIHVGAVSGSLDVDGRLGLTLAG